MKKQFQYGKYIYDYVLKFEVRKTLSLTVTPDIELIVKAPTDTEHEKIEAFLRRKWVWLEKQVRFFSKFKKKIYRREYVSDESFFYLGRQYQLIVQRGKERGVSLQRGKLVLTTNVGVTDGDTNKRILQQWFKDKTLDVFNGRLDAVFGKFEYPNRPVISVKNMAKRWGSFIDNKRIVLNEKLIHASKDCIDYVITHELCHFRYKKHSTAFYRLLAEKYPDWERIKDKLESRYL